MSQLQLFPMSVGSHLSGTSQQLSTWHSLRNQLFLVSIKSFFQNQNILENIVPTPLQQVMQLSVRNLQEVSDNWIKFPCKVTSQSSDYQCHLDKSSLSYSLLHNRITHMKFVTKYSSHYEVFILCEHTLITPSGI